MTSPAPSSLPHERACRLALLRTVRDLRWSARRRRPISLPNVRRLLQRRLSLIANDAEVDDALQQLAGIYRYEQRQWRLRAG